MWKVQLTGVKWLSEGCTQREVGEHSSELVKLSSHGTCQFNYTLWEFPSWHKGPLPFLGPRCSTLHFYPCLRSEEWVDQKKALHAIPFILCASPAPIACHSTWGKKQGQIKSSCQDSQICCKQRCSLVLMWKLWLKRQKEFNQSPVRCGSGNSKSFFLFLTCSAAPPRFLSFKCQCALHCLWWALPAKLQ